VKSIAKSENISVTELDNMKGSGKDGRVTKADVLDFLKDRGKGATTDGKTSSPKIALPPVNTMAGDQVVEMDRMRKLIADHMVM